MTVFGNQRTVRHRQAVVAILKAGESFAQLLGTGFFVGTPPVIVTARHVFQDNPLDADEHYLLDFDRDDLDYESLDVLAIDTSDTHDIAVVRLNSPSAAVAWPLRERIPAGNEDVLTYEFSTTRVVRDDQDENVTVIDHQPLTRKGNVVRSFRSRNDDHPRQPIGTWMMEMSFPALQGASGAPIVSARDFTVVGMTVGNVARELVPAQVVNITFEGGGFEKVSYYLPFGRAIAAHYIAEYLRTLNIEFDLR